MPNGVLSRSIDPTECFPAQIPILTSLTTSTAISALRVGDIVLSYDSRVNNGRGPLTPLRIRRLYRNTTTEWIVLRWVEAGEARELTLTPGHHVLDQYGQFPTIEAMLRDGVATVVLASGALAQVTAERIVYSAATAHLYERAQSVGMIAGNAALQPVLVDAWQTYNFEVEDLHTYVAGGVRVHNASGHFGVNEDGIRGQYSHTRFEADGDPEFARIIGPGAMPDTYETVRPGGGYRTVYNDNLVNGDPNPFAGYDWQPGGDYDEDGSLEDSDRRQHNADIYDRQAAEARELGNPLQAQYYEDRAARERATAAALQGSDNGADDDGGITQATQDAIDAAVQTAVDAATSAVDDDAPILLDLDGNGVKVTDLSRSTVFMDAANDGYKHRTAWAGRGDGVLFFDVGNDGLIEETREYVFTEWDGKLTTAQRRLDRSPLRSANATAVEPSWQRMLG